MNLKKYLKTACILAITAFTASSCVKKDEWETPPINCTNKFDAPNITLAAFKALAPASGYLLITEDKIFDAYIVSSDESGNFYKTVSFQDKAENPTTGMQIEVDKSSNYKDFPVGAHIRINAKGLRLGLDRGVVKIGSVDPTYAIGRIPSALFSRYVSAVCNGGQMDVATLKPVELPNLTEAKKDQYINTLVSVPNVQFNISDLYPVNKTFIDYVAGAGADTDRTIEDATGGSSVLRSSGYATYGATLLPKGSGTLTFVVSKYNSNYQMLIRGLDDVKLPPTGTRFDPTPPKGGSTITYPTTLNETFEGFSPAGLEAFAPYINDPVLGNRYWRLTTFNNNNYIQLSGNAGTGAFETFFIVPVTFTPGKKLTFDVNVGFYTGDALKVFTSTDYVPLGDVTSATVTDITSAFTIPKTPASGYGTFVPAGTYEIPSTLSGKGFVMFKYVGNGSGVTTTIQLDKIALQ